jgi:crotonobetainyl-CoA:carnitine CoA-transferase CaiB-like acyl-CoA transferase
VVDLADEKGELCGRLLADFGADVLRVEPPQGARSRQLPPFHGGRSLYFAYRNSNKRGVALDLESAADREKLLALLPRADVFIESEKPGVLAKHGLAPSALCERFPHLIGLSITDFGQFGPYRDWAATSAQLEAMGAVQFKAGTPDKAPLLPPVPLAWDVAGVMGAFSVLLAVLQRQRTSFGQAIDLSALEAIAQAADWSFSNGSYTIAKGAAYNELRMGSGPMYRIFACKGGYVRLVILSPRQWRSMRAWLGEPDYLQDKKYESFLGRMEIADALGVMIGDLFATMTHEEVAAEAQRRGIVCTPVLRPEEVLANEHFRSRNTFADTEYAPGESGPVAAGFYELDGERLGIRARAPEIGEHQALLGGGLWPDARPKPVGARPAPSLPLAGLRVLDFGIGGVGVEAGRLLAEYGADVLKIESRSYPDFIRTVMSSEMSASFASSSRSKRGFGVNLKHEKGLALLHRLAGMSDVVIENNSTGTMDDMGLGYRKLRELNPRIVMVSSQLLGSRGTWANWIGYGPSTQPIGGLVHLWNYADQDFPAGSTSIFPDHLAGRLSAIGVLASLVARAASGAGAHVEVAQAEAVVNMLGDQLLAAGLAPGSVVARGNRNLRGVPWGSYPCAGTQQWCVISCRSDEDWRRLRMAMGEPAWAMKPELETLAGRRAAENEIDAKLAEWTAKQTKHALTGTCQMFGVPAAPTFGASDMLADPHYQIRGFARWVEQQDLGWIAMEGPCFRASGMSDVVMTQAPKVGEHTAQVCRELLGMGDREIQALFEAGTLEQPR